MPQALNQLLSIACLLLAIVLPLGSLLYFGTIPAPELTQMLRVAEALPIAHFEPWQRFLVVGLSTLPAAFTASALLRVRSSFASFARKDYFSMPVVRGLRGFAAGIFCSGLAGILVTPLLSFTLSATDPRGSPSVSFNLGTQQLVSLLFAGIVWQIANVLTQAKTFADENAQFV
jgi:hypothetical protein